MAKTDPQITRNSHSQRKQIKSRPPCVQSVAHHVTDLQKMGLDEAQAPGTMDSQMGIATDVRSGPGARSRTSLVVCQLRCKPFSALVVFAVNQLFDMLINVSNGSLQVIYQSNPRSRGLYGHVSMRSPFFVLGGYFPSVADVRRPPVSVCLSGSSDVLSDLVYLFLELILFSGLGGRSGASVEVFENLWGFVSSD